MWAFFFSKATIHRVINLRSAAIAVQLILVAMVEWLSDYNISLLPILLIIAFESLFNVLSMLFYWRKTDVNSGQLMLQYLADILFLACLLAFSGGATNAFVSLLLIPIALSAITLSTQQMLMVTLTAIAAYSLLLYQLPAHSLHHMDMQAHFVGMWVNFLFSAAVVSLVVGQLARQINKRERAIAGFREEQLKQAQLVSIGIASAQVTHQLATPIATVQLLADELIECYPDNELVNDMQTQLARCRESIQSYRELALASGEQALLKLSHRQIKMTLVDNIALNFPDIKIELLEDIAADGIVVADNTFIPAILSLIQNGIRASKQQGDDRLVLSFALVNQRWQLTIRDYGKGFSRAKLTELGASPIASEQGLGMAVYLSHASLDRLAGKIELRNHQTGGAEVVVSLPFISDKENEHEK